MSLSNFYPVAVTGHRPNKLGGYKPNPVQDRVRASIRKCILAYKEAYPDLVMITGMALGVDQWVAEICIDLGVPFWAAIPFAGQELAWPKPSQDHYRKLLAKAAEVTVVCEGGYELYKMQVRNEWMVDRCRELMAVWDGTQGGTGNCVNYAQKVQKPMQVVTW